GNGPCPAATDPRPGAPRQHAPPDPTEGLSPGLHPVEVDHLNGPANITPRRSRDSSPPVPATGLAHRSAGPADPDRRIWRKPRPPGKSGRSGIARGEVPRVLTVASSRLAD